jgi:hypothetical protein
VSPLYEMVKSVTVTVFPRLNADICGTGCGVSCSSCTGCDLNCGFTESEQEEMDNLFFLLEEIGYKLYENYKIEFINALDIDYSIERLNMILVTSGEETVTHYTYGEYMTENSPIIVLNSIIVTKGKIPNKEELERAFTILN